SRRLTCLYTTPPPHSTHPLSLHDALPILHAAFLDDDLADFHQVLSINLLGVMTGTREAARHMAANGGGSIVNLSSIGGIQAGARSEEHTSELQSRSDLVCRLLLEKKKVN